MFRSVATTVLSCSLSMGLLTFAAHTNQAIAQDAPTQIQVSAPLAQTLVDQTMAKHSDIGKLGIHAVPPDSKENVIIACNIRSKNGKKSSPADLEKLSQQKPFAVRVDKEQIFDLLIPMTDAHGHDLKGGFVVMEVPLSKANSEEDALKIGLAIRDEIQAQIPNKAALYKP